MFSIWLKIPKKNFAAYNIRTSVAKVIKRNPMANKTQSIINDIRFPNLPITGPTKNIGKYWPIMLKEAETLNNKVGHTDFSSLVK